MAQVNEHHEMQEISRLQANLTVSRESPDNNINEETKPYESSQEEIDSLKRQLANNKETIASLRERLDTTKLDALRSIVALRRENTELIGYNNHLSWEAADLATRMRNLERLNAMLRYQNVELGGHRDATDPTW